ncbi:MAG: 2OG-Fe(II) oxygenase [Kordiimonadaceae bacterium]|nr:2OG-Fe(II) oxygenase [Kordiimonadaceae bacterium]
MKRAIIDLNLEPRVYTVDNFISGAECRHVIAAAVGAGMEPAVVVGLSGGQTSKSRTNEVSWLNHDFNAATNRVSKRIAGLVGLPLAHAEKFQVIHYKEGAEYRPHFDAFLPSTPQGKRVMENGGQRLISVLGYLNTPALGGGTLFPKLDLTIPAELGKILVFHNCYAGAYERHADSLHGGNPVEAGEKWAFNLWFRAEKRS